MTFLVAALASMVASLPSPAPAAPTLPSDGSQSAYSLDDVFAFMTLESLIAPLVTTASRHEQSQDGAAQSITVISADEIAAWGSPQLPDVLRLVPGLVLEKTNTNAFFVGARGVHYRSSADDPTRLLILIDGQRVNDMTRGSFAFFNLGLSPGDIERIEVMHGPGSAIYGSSAMTGVINIVTKRAHTADSLEANANFGTAYTPAGHDGNAEPSRWYNFGTGYVAGSASSKNNKWTARLSLGTENIPNLQGVSPALTSRGDYSFGANTSLGYNPTADTSIVATGRAHSTETVVTTQEVAGPESTLIKGADANIQLISSNFISEGSELLLQADTRWLDRQALATNGGFLDQTCFEVHDVTQLRLSTGSRTNALTLGQESSLGQASGTSETTLRHRAIAAYAQSDLDLAEGNLLLSAAVRYEIVLPDAFEGERPVYRNLSPRLSIIWKPVPKHSLRLTAGTAYRAPTFGVTATPISVEMDSRSVRVRVPNPYVLPEELQSAEMGYRGYFTDLLNAEATAFVQRASNLISLPDELDLPRRHGNRYNTQSVGTELQVRMVLASWATLRAHYSYVYVEDRETGQRDRAFPPQIAGLMLQLKTRSGIRALASAHYTQGSTRYTSTMLPSRMITATANHLDDQVVADLRIGKLAFDDRAELFLSAHNLVGFFLDRDQLKQYHAKDVTEPTGAMVFGGIRIAAPM